MPATACAGNVNIPVEPLPAPVPATACAGNVNIPVDSVPAPTTAYIVIDLTRYTWDVVCTTGGNLCSLV